MPDSCAPSPTLPTAARAGSRTLSPLFSPTHFHEEPVVDWLIRPDLGRLCTTQFERLTLEFVHESGKLRLEARQDARYVVIGLEESGRTLHPLRIRLQTKPADIRSDADIGDLLEAYRSLRPDPREGPIWEALRKLPKPVVIALDRTISAEADDILYTESGGRIRGPRAIQLPSPLRKVREVTAARYAKYRSKVIALNDVLKAKIVMSALRDPVPTANTFTRPRISAREIEQLEEKVANYLSTAIEGSRGRTQIARFFRRIKRLVSHPVGAGKRQDLFWGIVSNQYRQIEDLAKAFNEFERQSALAYENLKHYLETINLFFLDSQKQVSFDEATNQLSFRFLGTHGTPQATRRGIEHLSSGERQVLILFTFLAFVADAQRVFIVDEPELSLHPKWQAEFLDAFLRLKPKATQLLLATHSPEIVSGHKEDCVVLLP